MAWLAVLVPLAGSAGSVGFLLLLPGRRSVLAVALLLGTVLLSLGLGLASRRHERRASRRDRDRYRAYLGTVRERLDELATAQHEQREYRAAARIPQPPSPQGDAKRRRSRHGRRGPRPRSGSVPRSGGLPGVSVRGRLSSRRTGGAATDGEGGDSDGEVMEARPRVQRRRLRPGRLGEGPSGVPKRHGHEPLSQSEGGTGREVFQPSAPWRRRRKGHADRRWAGHVRVHEDRRPIVKPTDTLPAYPWTSSSFDAFPHKWGVRNVTTAGRWRGVRRRTRRRHRPRWMPRTQRRWRRTRKGRPSTRWRSRRSTRPSSSSVVTCEMWRFGLMLVRSRETAAAGGRGAQATHRGPI
jgi:hypothetical protein